MVTSRDQAPRPERTQTAEAISARLIENFPWGSAVGLGGHAVALPSPTKARERSSRQRRTPSAYHAERRRKDMAKQPGEPSPAARPKRIGRLLDRYDAIGAAIVLFLAAVWVLHFLLPAPPPTNVP